MHGKVHRNALRRGSCASSARAWAALGSSALEEAHAALKVEQQHRQRVVALLGSMVPQRGSCSNASSGRAWPARAARHSQGGARPVGPQPRPPLLERAASNVAHFTALDRSGIGPKYASWDPRGTSSEPATLRNYADNSKRLDIE